MFNEIIYKGKRKMGKVTKDMGIIDIVQQYPESLEVFAKYGLGCIGCAAARFENTDSDALAVLLQDLKI